jgi:uncharacterized protein (TIGR03435 family)
MMTTPRLFVFFGIVCHLAAQAPDSAHFEAASVKLSAPWDGGSSMASLRILSWEGGPGTASPTRLTIRNFILSGLVENAYGIQPFQLEGLPTGGGGINGDKFDIDATLPAGATKQQARLMLQDLLVQRFRLKFRWEKKEGPVYALVVGSKGHKLKESPPDAKPDDAARSSFTMRGTLVACKFLSMSMEEFASKLSGQVHSPVRDETGLTGKYDIAYEYQPNLSAAPGDGDPGEGGQDIFGAVQSHLGLKLERRKGTIDILVVEHVDRRPVEN